MTAEEKIVKAKRHKARRQQAELRDFLNIQEPFARSLFGGPGGLPQPEFLIVRPPFRAIRRDRRRHVFFPC